MSAPGSTQDWSSACLDSTESNVSANLLSTAGKQLKRRGRIMDHIGHKRIWGQLRMPLYDLNLWQWTLQSAMLLAIMSYLAVYWAVRPNLIYHYRLYFARQGKFRLIMQQVLQHVFIGKALDIIMHWINEVKEVSTNCARRQKALQSNVILAAEGTTK